MCKMRCPVIIALLLASVARAADPPSDLAQWLQPQTWTRDVPGPIVSLGKAGDFDDQHIFAPGVAEENGKFLLWYSGSRGTPGNRVFRLGLATSSDGKQFEKYSGNPILQFADAAHSVLTPALLRNPDGSVLRENGKLRMWFASATLGKGGLHTLHESTSDDGIHWADPSPVLHENVYCPTVLKTESGYEMWFSDVSRRPWVIRHASSSDGKKWSVTSRPAIILSQDWEAEVLTYPTVLKVDNAYLMWYGSYDRAIRRETTAIGFAVSSDGLHWHKHPNNPVLRPDSSREWESNYVGSGSVMRLADGSFRYWYASRKAPPFLNLYFAINTVRWPGPSSTPPKPPERTALRLPPQNGDTGIFVPANPADARGGRSVDVLEVVDGQNAIVRAWYAPLPNEDPTYVDLWLQGINTSSLTAGTAAELPQVFKVNGSKLFDTTCGKRSLPLLEPLP